MTIAWEQLVYGKLVESPRGAIVSGLDYRVTGISSGYPPELVSRSHPHRTGVNTSDLFSWQKYPWNAGGGFILHSVLQGDTPVIIAGRIRGRSERGEGEAGRPYVQAHYAVTPVEGWSPVAIALLPRILDASPMMTENRSMPPLQLEDVAINDWFNRPLQSDWLEGIFELLTAVMSGVPLNVQDREASLDDFLDRCALCACAVPRTLAWRISIGAGLAEMRNDVSLGLGQFAPASGLRKVGPNLYGGELPELKAGRKYAEWLGKHAAQVRTPGDLCLAVRDLLPEFEDVLAVPAGVDASGAARTITSQVTELARIDELRAWLREESDQRPEIGFRLYRKIALEAVLSYLRPRGLELLPDFVLPGWSEIFGEIEQQDTEEARRARIIARLGGLDADPPRASDVEYFARDDLPPKLVRQIEEALDRTLANDNFSDGWTDHVRTRFESIPWLRKWFQSSNDLWFWFAVDCAESSGNMALLDALDSTGGKAAASFATLWSRAPHPECTEAAKNLVASAAKLQRVRNLNWLFEYFCKTAHVAAAIILAVISRRNGMSLEVARVFFAVEPADDRLRLDLAQVLADELDASSQPPDESIMSSLLVGASRRIHIGDHLRKMLASRLGNPVAQILIGVADSSSSRFGSESSREIARLACRIDPVLIEKLWSRLSCSGHAADPVEEFLLELTLDPQLLLSQASEKIKFVAHLRQGSVGELPRSLLTDADIELTRRLLRDRNRTILTPLAEARCRTQLINGLRLVDKSPAVQVTDPELIKALIEEQIEHRAGVELLHDRLREWDWHRAPVWRILFFPWAIVYDTSNSLSIKDEWDACIALVAGRRSVTKLAPEETPLLVRLSFPQCLALAAFGVDAPFDERFSGVTSVRMEMRRCNALALVGLARFFRRSGAMGYVRDVGEILLARVLESPSDAEQFASALSRGKWAQLTSKIRGDDLSPLVQAALETLELLPRERRAEWEHRLAVR
jgi:hypothetical protein